MDAHAGQRDVEVKARAFISYSRKDMPFVNQLEAFLKQRDIEALIDRTEIFAFEDWWKRIEATIGRADVIICVISPDYLISDVTPKELDYALKRQKRIAPIVCRSVEIASIPESLRRLNLIKFDDAQDFPANAELLLKALQTDIGWVRKHGEYGESARNWSDGGKASGLLLRTPALENAESWISSRPRGAPEAPPEVQAFIAESRRGATRRRNALTGSLAVGLLIALGLVGIAYWQRGVAIDAQASLEQQRQDAENSRVAEKKQREFAEAQRNLADVQKAAAEKETIRALIREARVYGLQENYGASVTTALKAHEISGFKLDPETHRELVAVLYNATLNNREKFVLSTTAEKFSHVSLSPNGAFVFTVSNERGDSKHLLRVWSATTAKLISQFSLDAFSVDDLKITHDRKHLIAYSASVVFVFDLVPDGVRYVASISPPDPVMFVDSSDGGKYVTVGYLNGKVQFRDPKSLVLAKEFSLDETVPVVYADLRGNKLLAFTANGSGGYLTYADTSNAGGLSKARKKLNCLTFDSDLGIFENDRRPLRFYVPCGFMFAQLEARNGALRPFKFPELMDFVGGGLSLAAASQIDDYEIALLSLGHGSIYLFSDGKLERKMSAHPRATFISKSASFREADGRLFASASTDYTARLWKSRRDESIATLAGHTGAVVFAEIAGAPRQVLTSSTDGTARVWSFWPRAVTLVSDEQADLDDCDHAIRRNEELINVNKVGNDFRLFIEGAEVKRFGPSDGSKMVAYCVSPDSKYLIMGTRYGRLEIVEVATLERVATLDLSGLANGSNQLLELKISKDQKSFLASFPKITAKWPIMESDGELIAQAKASQPVAPPVDKIASIEIVAAGRHSPP